MRQRFLVIAITFVICIPLGNVAIADVIQKQIVLGSAIPLELVGSQALIPAKVLSNGAVDAPMALSILPPCPPGIDQLASSRSLEAISCIRSFKAREIGSNTWHDGTLWNSSISDYLETSTQVIPYSIERVAGTGVYRSFGGSSSLWKLSKEEFGSSIPPAFLIEATHRGGNTEVFSLSLVPVTVEKEKNPNLNRDYLTSLSRIEFPKNLEYQIVISLGHNDEILPFWVTSRVRAGSISHGPNNNWTQLVFEGQAQEHGVLSKPINSCKEELLQSDLVLPCLDTSTSEVKVQPDDQEILKYLNDEEINEFTEQSRIQEWGFQGGQTGDQWNRFSIKVGKFEYPCQQPFAVVMSTNASVFSFKAPLWDAKTSSFIFKIGNSHFDLYGQKSKGYFSVSLNYWDARCIWNLQGDVTLAQVQILSEDGSEQKGFTSYVRIDSRLERAFIQISGFEFSSPTISLKLKDSSPKKTETTIICVKGNVKKNIKGLNPKCPSGFRKK